MCEGCVLFDGISAEQCDAMMHCLASEEKSFKTGETILDYSKNSNKVGVIETGTARMIRIDMEGNRTILETMSKDSVFGETLAFSGGRIDSIYVECTSPCKIVFLEYDHITKRCEKACMHHTLLVQNMFRIIADKLLAMSNRVEILSNRTIRQKLLCYFNLSASAQKNVAFNLPFSITTLADYIATDRSAMMRELKKMKAEGIIEMNKREIKLL